MRTIVALTGMPGSGKSRVARALARAHGYLHVPMSALLIEVSDGRRDPPPSEAAWQQVETLRENLGCVFLAERAWAEIERYDVQTAVVDGIRHIEECLYFGERALVLVVAFQRPPHLRHRRLREGTRTDLFKEQPEMATRLDHHELALGTGSVIALADHVVFSSSPEGALDEDVTTASDVIARLVVGLADRRESDTFAVDAMRRPRPESA